MATQMTTAGLPIATVGPPTPTAVVKDACVLIDERVPLACALRDRVPLPVLCCVYSFLEFREHSRMAGAGRHFRRAALLPESSCHDISAKWDTLSWDIVASQLRQRPRTARFNHPLARIDEVVRWLSAAPQLHTLQLGSTERCNLALLAQLTSLRHLLLNEPDTASLASALRACGRRLLTLHICNADAIEMQEPVGVRGVHMSGDETTVARQLAACTALESLALHARNKFALGTVVSLGQLGQPALRSLSLIQHAAASNDLTALATQTNLSALCYHLHDGSAHGTPCAWPSLPGLRALDLGSSAFKHDYRALAGAFPLLGRLRIACADPAELARFPKLTDLTIIDSANASKASWLDFMDQVVRLLPLLEGLERLGVQCYRRFETFAERVWRLPRVTHLTLCLETSSFPRIRAPLLRVLRARRSWSDAILAEAVAEIVVGSPLLESVTCHTHSPVTADGPVAAALKRTCARVRIASVVTEFSLRSAFCSKTFAAADNWL